MSQKDLERLSDLLYWTWSCQIQLRRFLDSFAAQLPGFPLETIDARRRAARAHYDEHVAFVAVRNLLRASERAGKSLPKVALPAASQAAVTALRNAYEHWPRERATHRAGRSSGTLGKLARLGARPWTVGWSEAEGITLGSIVTLRDLEGALGSLEKELLALGVEQHGGGHLEPLLPTRPPE